MWRAQRIIALKVAGAGLAGLGVLVVPAPTEVAAQDMPIFVDYDKPTPGRRGPVAVVGDSVMLGSAYETNGWGPSVAQMLQDRGWGPIRLHAGVGFNTGFVASGNRGADVSRWLRTQRAEGFDPHVIMVSLGPGDILYCEHSTICAEQSIDHFMDVAGDDHEVWWTLITMTEQRDQDAWNSALQRVAARRPNLTLWDWPTVQQQAGIPLGNDRIHLAGIAAYRARSEHMANHFTETMGLAKRDPRFVPGTPPGPQPPPEAFGYQPVPPRRVLDTRTTGQRLPAGGTLTVDLGALAAEFVTPDVRAVSLNVAAADPAAEGYLTAYPCDRDRPLAASVNFPAGQPRSAQVLAVLSATRTLCVYSLVSADVVIDLQGVFTPTAATRFAPATPTRLLDTRLTGRQQVLTVTAPVGATAVAVTLTVANGQTAGFLAAFPCGDTVPTVANVNWARGEIIAGAAFVPVAANGTFCVYTNADVDVIVDLTGTFSASAPLRFVPSTPARQLDTRRGSTWLGPIGMDQTIEFAPFVIGAVAVSGTIVIIDPAVDGYLTGTTCGQPPGQTSSVSAARGEIVANALTIGLSSTGTACISAYAAAHAVFDMTGWWVT